MNPQEPSYLGSLDPAKLEELYAQYRTHPDSIDYTWRKFFEGFDFARQNYQEPPTSIGTDGNRISREFRVIELINAYRERGHFFTKTNPVRSRRKYFPTIDIENFGLDKSDLNTVFEAGTEIGLGPTALSTICEFMQQTYCQSIGVEYMYIRSPEIVAWLRTKMEKGRNTPVFEAEKKLSVFKMLTRAVGFEQFLRKRFPGQKRFSLEGSEALIPALDSLVETGAQYGLKEIVIGMAHRGRLNVLGNIMKKPFHRIFSEFEGKEYDDDTLLGDVKYHMGCSTEKHALNGEKVLLHLVPNPSHLEAVDPVVEGIARAKADQNYAGNLQAVLPVLIHGDAAVAGQGIVYEVIQMSQLPGYKTGGTIHLIINNQLGFTTNYLDARSGIYCTDVAKTVQSPIFHVNADDAEAVVYVMELAMEFRQKFGRDVFIDLLGYRRHGHNESDEPRFTQPILYKIIENHPDAASIYLQKLIAENFIDASIARSIASEYESMLDRELTEAASLQKGIIDPFLDDVWADFIKPSYEQLFALTDTRVNTETLRDLGRKTATLPVDKPFFRKTRKLFDDRLQMIASGAGIDWATAETLAYATLLDEGKSVRISGQDVERGTFSHRHAVLKMEHTEEEYIPLNSIGNPDASFEIYNSLLSEYGVMGFEYGYAMASPSSLVIWEAQFGDFHNGAQIIVDNFIATAEEKWKINNGLVLYLPHGFEGQGPEHSSARIERFLSLCAGNNMQIVNCTTPANFFHLLRQQMHRRFRKPLVVFTPKSLLRHPKCVSDISQLSSGHFNEVIDDIEADAEQINRVLLCSGKVYYDLLEEKQTKGYTQTAIIRLEQLYPLPLQKLQLLVKKYRHAQKFIWVQEEPQNMGAWPFLAFNLPELKLSVISRPPSGSPASGSSKFHQMQQRKIAQKAFEECDCPDVCRDCRQLCISNLVNVV